MNQAIRTARILLVEDEHFMRMLIVQALESLGFNTVHEAEDSQQAIRVLATEAVDLVITDIEMRPMNGLDLVKRIRTGQTALPRDARVIFLTGLGDMTTLSAASELDVHSFLIKPVSANQLRGKIEDALRTEVRLRDRSTYEALTFVPAGVTTHQADQVKRAGYTLTSVATPRTEPPYAATRPKPVSDASGSCGVFLPVDALQPGMILCHDIITRGVPLLRKGAVLAPGHIQVLKSIRTVLEQSEFEVKLPGDQAR